MLKRLEIDELKLTSSTYRNNVDVDILEKQMIKTLGK